MLPKPVVDFISARSDRNSYPTMYFTLHTHFMPFLLDANVYHKKETGFICVKRLQAARATAAVKTGDVRKPYNRAPVLRQL